MQTETEAHKLLLELLRRDGSPMAGAAVAAITELAAERDMLLDNLVPFAGAHKVVEQMPMWVTRYSFHVSQLAAARDAVNRACGIDWPTIQKEAAR